MMADCIDCGKPNARQHLPGLLCDGCFAGWFERDQQRLIKKQRERVRTHPYQTDYTPDNTGIIDKRPWQQQEDDWRYLRPHEAHHMG